MNAKTEKQLNRALAKLMNARDVMNELMAGREHEGARLERWHRMDDIMDRFIEAADKAEAEPPTRPPLTLLD